MYPGTITRKMKNQISEISKRMLTRRDFNVKLARLKEAEQSERPTACAELCRMFHAVGIECKTGQDDSYYEELISKNKFYKFEDIESRIIKIMFESFSDYPTPEKYMLRIVDRLSKPEDGWQNDTLRLRILKQFIKYGNCMTYGTAPNKVHIYNGEGYLKKYAKEKSGRPVKTIEDIYTNIDDSIFDVLQTSSNAQIKPDGTYGILKAADDLANGIFKSGGATKKDLYMFAMVFNMTYTISKDEALTTEKIVDYESDIEKNLFEDYYNNNLMRFITSAYEKYEGKLNAVESDPSGQGINYKNFAEMIYIYFISKNYEPYEKIRRSDEMIKRLANCQGNQQSENSLTEYYTALFTDDILKMSETEFEEFISQNYDCNVELTGVTSEGKSYKTKKGELQLQTAQNTAFILYNNLINNMEDEIWYDGLDDCEFLRENCNYGLWFTDILAVNAEIEEEKAAMDNALKEFFKIDSDNKKAAEFIKLLNYINRFLLQSKMKVEKAEKMTRTALITAYYYWYNIINEHNETEKNFIDVMADYTNPVIGLNSYLAEAGYQPISEKNIFDMAVIFSSYAYLAK